MGSVDIYPPSQPSGMALAYAEVTANQTGIVGSTVDLTGLTVTVTVPAGRRIKITGHVLARSTVANDVFQLGIQEGGTLINAGKDSIPTTDDLSIDVFAVFVPTAGTHTYKLTALRSSGSGSLNIAAGANFPSYILVEDITGTIYPTGTLVTAGIVASEVWPTWSPIVTQSTTPAQTVNYAKYIRFGRLVVAQCTVSFTGAGTAANAILVTNLPITAHASSPIMGSFRYFDTGNTNFAGTAISSGATACALVVQGDGNLMGQGSPTIANGDFLQLSVTYEAVS